MWPARRQTDATRLGGLEMGSTTPSSVCVRGKARVLTLNFYRRDGDAFLRQATNEGIDGDHAFRIVQRLLLALETAHGEGVVPRAIKPENARGRYVRSLSLKSRAGSGSAALIDSEFSMM
jgi:hypothetical protein